MREEVGGMKDKKRSRRDADQEKTMIGCVRTERGKRGIFL